MARFRRDMAGSRSAFFGGVKGAEIGHSPIQSDKPQQAFKKVCRLPQWQAEQNFHRHAGPDLGVAELLLPTTLAGRRWHTDHLGIKPDRL